MKESSDKNLMHRKKNAQETMAMGERLKQRQAKKDASR